MSGREIVTFWRETPYFYNFGSKCVSSGRETASFPPIQNITFWHQKLSLVGGKLATSGHETWKWYVFNARFEQQFEKHEWAGNKKIDHVVIKFVTADFLSISVLFIIEILNDFIIYINRFSRNRSYNKLISAFKVLNDVLQNLAEMCVQTVIFHTISPSSF